VVAEVLVDRLLVAVLPALPPVCGALVTEVP
jgi:hypothetical protein